MKISPNENPILVQWRCDRGHLHCEIMTDVETAILTKMGRMPRAFTTLAIDPQLRASAIELIKADRDDD